jgi:hypothetical protein
MKNLVLSLVMVVSFITVSTAQQKEIVKETINKEVKKGEANSAKSCCADKKAEKHANCDMKKHEGHAKTDGMKCCAEKSDEKKAECDMKKHEGHATMDGMKCEPNCTKPCCADKNTTEVKKEVIKVEETAKMAFACPMKCEGEKTYAKEGKCPKCNMNLKPVKN